jgi:hypothetical protein
MVVVTCMVALVAASPGFADELPVDRERIGRALQGDRPALVLPAFTPDVAAGPRDPRVPERGRQASSPVSRSDSVWEGTLIGAAIGGAGGFVWARQICGADDSECVAIAGPVGILGGAGIGALVGAIADKLHK